MSRIEHFAVYAEDPTALKEFFVKAMGLHVIVENAGPPPAYFLADDHGMALEILKRAEEEPAANQRWICHLAFWVEDFVTARNELDQIGIVFEDETLVETDELKTAFFKDPAGNRCQIVWRRRKLGARD
jgi:glyoxylase I family protein